MPDLDGSGSADDQIPRPDPTVRTEERLRREIDSLGKSFKKDVDCIKEVSAEKFTGFERELANLAERTAEQKVDVKEAVVNALQSAKELVSIQNTNTVERLAALSQQIADQRAATDTVLGDLKDRVVRIEAGKVGGQEAVTTHRATATDQRAVMASLIGVVLFVLTVAGFVIALVANKP